MQRREIAVRQVGQIYVRISALVPNQDDYIRVIRVEECKVGRDQSKKNRNGNGLMIVDDETSILGPKTLTDRSLNGSRDFELGLVVSGGEVLEGKIGGKFTKKSGFSYGLRKDRWRKMFSVGEIEVDFSDPLSDEAWRVVRTKCEVYFN